MAARVTASQVKVIIETALNDSVVEACIETATSIVDEIAAANPDVPDARLALIECNAPLEVLRARLATRASSRGASDGRAEILTGQMDIKEPVQPLPGWSYVTIDTSSCIEYVMEEIWRQI